MHNEETIGAMIKDLHLLAHEREGVVEIAVPFGTAGKLSKIQIVINPLITVEPVAIPVLVHATTPTPIPTSIMPMIPVVASQTPVRPLPSGSSKLVLWPPMRDSVVNKATGNRRMRRVFLILMIPLILLLLLTGVGLGWPKTPRTIGAQPPAKTMLDTPDPGLRPHHPVTAQSYSCHQDQAVKLGIEAGGRIPVDDQTKHAQRDQSDDCELYFGPNMHGFVARYGLLIEEQRWDGSVYIWAGDGQTIVKPNYDKIVLIEFWASQTDPDARHKAAVHEDEAVEDWFTELGIPYSMIHQDAI